MHLHDGSCRQILEMNHWQVDAVFPLFAHLQFRDL